MTPLVVYEFIFFVMMGHVNIKWAALFLLLILLPASILTYLSVRVFQNEQRSALADLSLLAPRFQNAFDGLLERAMRDTSGVFVQATCEVDVQGVFVKPRVLSLTFGQRSDAFHAEMLRGEQAEFIARDFNEAKQFYSRAQLRASSDMERVESLNALGRVTLGLQDTTAALAYLETLRSFITVLDADGAHPYTLSILRLAQVLPKTQSQSLIEGWVDDVLTYKLPIHPGMLYCAQQLRGQVTVQRIYSARIRALRGRLDQIIDMIGLVEVYDKLALAGFETGENIFRSGIDGQDQSVLVGMRSVNDGVVLGVGLNVDALADSLMKTSVGQTVRENGFGLRLLDVDAISTFENRYQDVIHMVVPASHSLYRLNFGFYTRNQFLVTQRHRERNAFVVIGILALAGLMGVGAFLIYRDAMREITLARLQSDFVANVSHELRTPLTSIQMYAETLFAKRYRNDDQMQNYLKTILQESGRLSRQVGNVLDFSRIESGRKTYDLALCAVGKLVRETVGEFEAMMEEQGFEWEVNVQADMPELTADGEALQTALANLLSNAIKYSREEKQIRISAEMRGEHCLIEVADRGIGVSDREREMIFQKFRRGTNAGAAATGTGLGLALVKSIVDAHDGQVICLPREGGGSVFQMVLPLKG